MNEASAWRLDVARRIAPVYAANPKVAAVMVGGSTARGNADGYSDIELGVFWHEPPTDDDRMQPIAEIGGDVLRLYAYDPAEEVWSDDYTLGRIAPHQPKTGVLVELINHTTEFAHRVLGDVLSHHDPNLLKQNLVAGISQGVPLHGGELVSAWQARTASYPDGLAVAVVKAHAVIDHYWRLSALMERDRNLMVIHGTFSQVHQRLLHVLLAVNRRYYFGFKWLNAVVAELRIAPPELATRIRQAYQTDPVVAIRQTAALVEEVYDLLDEHVAGVDVEWLRRVFRYQRPSWETAPPGAL